ncbi:MAG: DUF1214 domain-containing protein [Gammaproteobacteria bacterium]|nr:MAG: DUF1214 domain-containing protein [Gammaproteobacteria bacterium]
MESPESLLSGKAWADFCDTLKRAGQQVLRPEAPDSPLDRAEGYRYLTRLLRIALDMHVESADRDFPVFYKPSHETAKIGADNPDNLYLRAELNGAHDYRITGSRGTVDYLGFGTQAGGYEKDGRNAPTGYLDSRQLQVDADGRFTIILSANQQPGNWLPMTHDTRTVIVRQTFLDRASETPATMTIERLDAGSAPAPLQPQVLLQGLAAAAGFVEGTARLFADWAQSYQSAPNQLPPADQALCQAVGGDPNIFYYHGYYDLTDDQALVIDVARIPDCQTWNLQVNNYWMESLDYRYHRIHVNKHTAHRRVDGSVRIVVCANDPMVANWLTTAGHRVGTLCFRWVGAKEIVHPQVRVVPLHAVKDLP